MTRLRAFEPSSVAFHGPHSWEAESEAEMDLIPDTRTWDVTPNVLCHNTAPKMSENMEESVQLVYVLGCEFFPLEQVLALKCIRDRRGTAGKFGLISYLQLFLGGGYLAWKLNLCLKSLALFIPDFGS